MSPVFSEPPATSPRHLSSSSHKPRHLPSSNHRYFLKPSLLAFTLHPLLSGFLQATRFYWSNPAFRNEVQLDLHSCSIALGSAWNTACIPRDYHRGAAQLRVNSTLIGCKLKEVNYLKLNRSFELHS